MSLQILKTDYTEFGDDPMRTFHDGHIGDSQEQIFYLRNRDASKYYTNITITPVFIGGYDDDGEFGVTGWGVKLMYGRRRPTEEEWDMIQSGSAIEIPDIGTLEGADTFTNHPIWVRVYCPGNEPAQIRENIQLNISYLVKEVSA